MVKTYRSIQQWDHWLAQSMGLSVHQIEQSFLAARLPAYHGKHALVIGTPRQHDLLEGSKILQHTVLSPLVNPYKTIQFIESEFYKLPIASGSVDLVILPHTLEFVDNPRQVMSEVCRIIKPEGFLLLLGFNPNSLWGFKKWLLKNKNMPWSSHFIRSSLVKKWLSLADFELVKQDMLLFTPPFANFAVFNKKSWLETLGRYLYPFWGGIYVLTFKAKVIPLTPIKMHWKQSIPALSATMPRPTMRDMQ